MKEWNELLNWKKFSDFLSIFAAFFSSLTQKLFVSWNVEKSTSTVFYSLLKTFFSFSQVVTLFLPEKKERQIYKLFKSNIFLPYGAW